MNGTFKPPPFEYPVEFVRGGHRRAEAAFGNRSALSMQYRVLYGLRLEQLRRRFRGGDQAALDEARVLASEVATRWETLSGTDNVQSQVRRRRLAIAG